MFALIILTLVGSICAQFLSTDYLPPLEGNSIESPNNEYLPPVAQLDTVLGQDGYRYKTVRRLRHRHRRDVSELSNDYLPPLEGNSIESPNNEYLPPVAQLDTVLGQDGYRYKTVRRLRHRHRRDVSELNNDYLPPLEGNSIESPNIGYLPPVAQLDTVLGQDGYRYKTIRRLRHRHRRDVLELNNDYLPPLEGNSIESPNNEYLPPVAQLDTVLGQDGYRYKTVRRLRHRHRRDVSELNNDYLPPLEGNSIESPNNEYLPPVAQLDTVLGQDGYRYKTVRRLRHRHRRDVSELNNDYLPPLEGNSIESPNNEYLPPVAQLDTVLGQDGYRYKTVRRLRHRHRRDVSELNNDYLPPLEGNSIESPNNEYSPPVAQLDTVLGQDGYRYKTVRRLRHRHRRDIE